MKRAESPNFHQLPQELKGKVWAAAPQKLDAFFGVDGLDFYVSINNFVGSMEPVQVIGLEEEY
jgi:hypothetical protein